MNRILIDTSTKGLTLVLLKDEEIIYSFHDEEFRNASENIIPKMIEGASKANIEFKDFDEIYVTDGPGSYTGERIGLTVAKTYAVLNSNVKIYISSSLKAMSSLIEGKSLLLLDARNSAYFAGAYFNSKPLFDEKRMEQEEVDNYLKENKELVIGVLPYFEQEAKSRFKDNKIVSISMDEALIKGRKYFELSELPLTLKARYLRGNND